MSENKIDDGGQAFPMPASETSQGGHFEQNGMSLRDWFAGQAMQGICAHSDNWGLVPSSMGTTAYEIADAMIAARKGRSS